MVNIQNKIRFTLKEKLEILKSRGNTYDCLTGEIHRNGVLAGSVRVDGYIILQAVYEKQHLSLYAHQFAWYMHYGKVSKYIDHDNHIRNDNRIINLLDGTPRSNNFNRKDVKGYYWSKQKGRWRAEIWICDKKVHLGFFEKEDDARKAYLESKKTFHPTPNRPESTNSENIVNHENIKAIITGYKISTKLVKGYTWNKQANKWYARLTINKQTKSLGLYDSEEDARNAYLEAKKILNVTPNQ